VERRRRAHADARDRLVTGHGRGDDHAPVESARLAERQHGRDHHRGGVGHRRRVGVVEVEAVGQRAVEHDRDRRARRELGADHRALAPSRPRFEAGTHGRAHLVRGCGQRDPEHVERPELHVAHDRGGQGLEREV
jgi:hypothetical protein